MCSGENRVGMQTPHTRLTKYLNIVFQCPTVTASGRPICRQKDTHTGAVLSQPHSEEAQLVSRELERNACVSADTDIPLLM